MCGVRLEKIDRKIDRLGVNRENAAIYKDFRCARKLPQMDNCRAIGELI